MKKSAIIAVSLSIGLFAAAFLTIFVIQLCNHVYPSNIPGDISKTTVVSVPSQSFSQDDINDAINTAKQYFHDNYNDCTLTEISYVGDERNPQFRSWANRNQADEVIALISSFETGPNPDIGLNRNGYYEQWKWVLARNNGGQWEHVNHGY